MVEKADAEKSQESTMTDNASNLAIPPHSQTPDASSSASENGDNPAGEKALGTAEPEKSPRNIHGIKWGFAVLSVLASTFLFALDNTIVADVQPAIVERFGDVGKLPWLSVAFLVAAAGTNLIWYVTALSQGHGPNNIFKGEKCMPNSMPNCSTWSLSSCSKLDPPSVVPLI